VDVIQPKDSTYKMEDSSEYLVFVVVVLVTNYRNIFAVHSLKPFNQAIFRTGNIEKNYTSKLNSWLQLKSVSNKSDV